MDEASVMCATTDQHRDGAWFLFKHRGETQFFLYVNKSV